MKKYGKIICGALQVPQNYPCSIELDGKTIHNPTEEQYLAAGYLPIEETPEPEPEEGKTAVATYAVNRKKTAIVQSWQYFDEPVHQPCSADVPPSDNEVNEDSTSEANGE